MFWTGCFRVTDTSYQYNRWVTRSYTILKATIIIYRIDNEKVISFCVYINSVFVIKPLNAPIRFDFWLFWTGCFRVTDTSYQYNRWVTRSYTILKATIIIYRIDNEKVISFCVYTSSVFVIETLNEHTGFAFWCFGQFVSVWRIPVTSIFGGSHGRTPSKQLSTDS